MSAAWKQKTEDDRSEDLARTATLEDLVAQLDRRMLKMIGDVRAESHAAVETAMYSEKSARDEADRSLDKRLQVVVLELDTQIKEQAARGAEVNEALDQISVRLYVFSNSELERIFF